MLKKFRFLLLFLCATTWLDVVSDTIPSKIPSVKISNDFRYVDRNGDSTHILDTRIGCWLFALGDKPQYSKIDFEDSKWPVVNTMMFEFDSVTNGFRGHAWFRLHLDVDSDFNVIPLVFEINQKGSSQIFFNGKFVKEIGVYGAMDDGRDNGSNDPLYLIPVPGKQNIIAIRYENKEYQHSFDNGSGNKQYGFYVLLSPADNFWSAHLLNFDLASMVGLGFFVFLFTIGVVHFLLYIFYRARQSNLYFSLFCFLFSYYFLHFYLTSCILTRPVIINVLTAILVISIPVFFFSLLTVLYSLFYEKKPKLWKISMWMVLSCSIMLMVFPELGFILAVIIVLMIAVELIRVIIVAIRKKKRGARIVSIGFGALSLFCLYTISVIFIARVFEINMSFDGDTAIGQIFFFLFFLSIGGIPLCMSTFLAWDFSQTSKTLSKKLVEVEELSAKSIEQEQEKQKILAEQNEVLEVQVEERTKEINEQKKVIEEKNKDITDSINYAQRIQRSILPTEQEIKDIFKECFVLFKPRDIVSGDFYQFKKNGDLKYAILADCTGHGVPGALMSMVGSNLLKQIILERGVKEPNRVLSELHKEVRSTLRQTGGVQSHDGMDATVLLLNKKKLYIASANRPVYIVKNGILTELRPDKRSIGGSQASDEIEFTLNEMDAEPGMMIYLFSDGYADQFGGEAGKKFKVKNLSDLLLKIHANPLLDQKNILNANFDDWKKHLEQVDDVSLIGIRF